jgi:phosphoserine phosphatase RsbU/P
MSKRADRPLIWITDDSAIEAKFTERALGSNYEFEYFADGSLVLERLSNGGRQPDLVLLDWVMPGVSGDEVCRFLRSQPQTVDLPVILVTASRVETKDIVEGLSIGANDYLARPFIAEELRARVDSAIRAKRMREVAARERSRLQVISRLGRSFVAAGPRLESVLELLAASLIDGLCEGCTITTIPGLIEGTTLARHRSGTHIDEKVLAAFAMIDPATYAFSSPVEAKEVLPAAYHTAIDRLGMSAMAVIPFPSRSPINGVVTVMRGHGGAPFEPEDIVTIETCLEYTSLALEKALRFYAERDLRQQMEAMVEHMPVGIVVADAAGALTHINQTALELVPQLKSVHSIAEMHQTMSMRDQNDAVLALEAHPLRRALAGHTTSGIELEFRVDDDASRFVRVSAVPLRDGSGAPGSAILAFDDITTQRMAANERERASELQRYVLGIVSHDLRSPLQTLMMGCEGIRMHAGGNTKVLQFVDRMESTAGRMRGIIEQLLDVVRAQMGGGIPLAPAEVDLRDIVSSVVGELAIAYPAARFEPKLESSPGTWDRDRLAQVVTNLVTNALQHGQKQSPVWIETEREGDEAILRVRNRSSTELTPDQKAVIFAPFRRTKRASVSGGLGLGLFIASEILRAHDGLIRVDTDPTTTTFTVRLPLSPRSQSAR